VSLFDALYTFFQEHRRCGELDGGVALSVLDRVLVRRGDRSTGRR
jgi:hypothetical protein